MGKSPPDQNDTSKSDCPLTLIVPLSDISEACPNGEISHYFRADWLIAMARETRANKEFSQRTQDTAR